MHICFERIVLTTHTCYYNTIRYAIYINEISIGLDNIFWVMYSQVMQQKLKIFTATQIRMRGLIFFGDQQFRNLKRRQLSIPVKLFKM